MTNSNSDRPSEFALIAQLFAPLAQAPGAFGLTDDAAVVAPPAGHELVITTDALVEGVHFLAGKFPLYAGLYLSDFNNDDEIRQGMQFAFKNGAAGVSLFGDVTKGNVLNILHEEIGNLKA